MKVTLGTYKSSRKLLSGVLLAVLVATSFLISPEPATSSTPITFSVTVKDRDSGLGIQGQAVDYCHSGSGEWQCASWGINDSMPEVETNDSGVARITISLPNGTGFVQLEAGGYKSAGTSYSKNWQQVDFVNGVPDWTPEIILSPTNYITVTVTVQSSDTPPVKIKNEWIQLSSGAFGEDPNDMREWAITGNIDERDENPGNAGKAVFYLDELIWGSVNVITAAVGVDSWSRFDFKPATVTTPDNSNARIRSATIVVDSTIYNLEGTITRETEDPEDPFVPFANQYFCLAYNNNTTGEPIQVNFKTDSEGNYLVKDVLSRDALQFQPHACDSYDEFSPFDYQNDVNLEAGSSTANVQFTSKGLKVTALEDGDPEKPAAFVLLRIELQGDNPDNLQDHRLATTNADGVAYFTNLQPGTEYLLSYRSSDEYSTPRHESVETFDLIPIGLSLTTRELTLSRKDGFPETPVIIDGTVLNPGVSDVNHTDADKLANGSLPGTPMANAMVYVTSSFGFNFNERVSFRTRTDSDGYFRFEGLPHGWISLDVSASGHRSVSRNFPTLVEETEYNLGNFRLRPSIPGDLQYSGVLRDVEGNPVPNITLVLNHPYESGKEPDRQETDESGRFSFTGLSAGHHWMYAQADWEIYDWNNWGFNLQSSKLNASHVILKRGVANPDAIASISGRVFEYLDVEGSSSPTPFENVCVQLYPTSGGSVSVGRTDALGNWSVSGLLDGEEYWIDTPRDCLTNSELNFNFATEYEYPDYGNSLAIAKVSGGTPHEWAFKKVSESGSGSVSGRVRDGDSLRNLAGMEIYLERANGGRVKESTTTDSRGEYEFLNLPAGEYYISSDPELSIDGDTYNQTWVSVQVTTEPNRANILLYKSSSGDVWDGIFSGTLLDEYGAPHANARVIVTNPDEYFWQGYAETDNLGKFEISDLPINTNLLLRIIPWWEELAVIVDNWFIDDSKVKEISETLGLGSSIAGQISNIPQGVEVRKIFAELLDDQGRFVHSAEVDLKTGTFSLKRVPAGQDYVLRFTQNLSVLDWENWSDPARQSVSMKPVYWKEGSASGTTDLGQATKISVGSQPVLGKNVNFSAGSTLQGSVAIATATNPIPLSGARELFVDLFKCDSDGEECYYVTWSSLSARTDYKYQFVGLAEGEYKVQFIDTRQGNNSLVSNFNDGAERLEDAPVVTIGDATTVTLDHTMKIAPPEKSAEAFDLDSLTAAQLADLKDAISLASESAPGSELEVFVGTEFAGNFVVAFANSTPVVLGDWKQVDSRGFIKVTIPTTLAAGSHRIGVLDSQGTVFGWAPITITAPAAVVAKPAAQPAATKAKPKTSTVVEAEPEETEEKAAPTEEAATAVPTAADSSGDWLLPLAGGFLLLLAAGSAWVMRAQRVGVRRK